MPRKLADLGTEAEVVERIKVLTKKRSISVRGITYERLKTRAASLHMSISQLVEQILKANGIHK